MKYFVYLIICLISLLNGCSLVPATDVNELNLIEGTGFDLTKPTEYRGTVIFPNFRSNGSRDFDVISAKGETIKRVRTKLDSQVRYRLISGQLRLVAFSMNFAKNGIFPIIDTFNRDPVVGSLLQLAIVDGETFDLLSLKEYKKENLALYLHDMLLHNSETGPLPYTDFSTFVYQYFEIGQDPYLPILKIDKKKIKISGIALFKGDKMVTTIPWKYVFIFKSIMESYKQGLHQFKFKDGVYIAIDNVKSKKKVDIKIKKNMPEFTIKLKMNARIQEYTGDKPIMFPKHIKEINKKLEKQIEKNGQELISILQKNNVDPLGLGSKLEAHQRDFDLKKWEKQYPNAKIKVSVDLDILHSGIVE
ncbi:Ger(x)C family spore germination protein [Gottfriedia acidiceleris]|uniref:Ger(x)C family spore germination protein n=1 Tax=Gottfriedia acidiceleris TaxID=371036 RepID=UPI000B44437F|nr:Ger(x)C family spore germination protein [Gottfriedia acidiceleris]